MGRQEIVEYGQRYPPDCSHQPVRADLPLSLGASCDMACLNEDSLECWGDGRRWSTLSVREEQKVCIASMLRCPLNVASRVTIERPPSGLRPRRSSRVFCICSE